MAKIVLIGGSGLGREIKSLVERDNQFIGFIDDQELAENYLGKLERVEEFRHNQLLVAIGDPQIKQKVVRKISDEPFKYANVISKHAIVDISQIKGTGIIICDGVLSTVNCQIGSHVLLNLNATIGHDVIIADYSSIMPGANISGNVKIGEATLIGSGAVILQGITIGSNVRVGAGAVVTKDIPDNTTVVGVPAKVVGN